MRKYSTPNFLWQLSFILDLLRMKNVISKLKGKHYWNLNSDQINCEHWNRRELFHVVEVNPKIILGDLTSLCLRNVLGQSAEEGSYYFQYTITSISYFWVFNNFTIENMYSYMIVTRYIFIYKLKLFIHRMISSTDTHMSVNNKIGNDRYYVSYLTRTGGNDYINTVI